MNCRFLTTKKKKEGGGTDRKEGKKSRILPYICQLLATLQKKSPK
jgi:hypothetical protein